MTADPSTKRILRSAVVILTLAASSCGTKNDAGAVVKEFATDVAAGRQGEALEQFDPQLRQVGGMMLGMAMAESARKAQQKGGLKDIQVVGTEQVDGNHATVTTKTTFLDGSTANDVSKVRLIDGRWYVTG